MKCPSCDGGRLVPNFIDDNLRSRECDLCGGDWLLIEDFVSWKEMHPEHKFSDDLTVEDIPQDTGRALFCPVTGGIMSEMRISTTTPHRIDYSAAVGGVWLDKGEWEMLKRDGIAGALNEIVTQAWQRQIKLDTANKNFAAIYADKFGEETYDRAKEVREWLHRHPQKAELRAYLMAEDPYSAQK